MTSHLPKHSRRKPTKIRHLMPAFTYRCPNTGYRVQGFTPGETVEDCNAYEAVLCVLCQRMHLVNPATGKVAGEEDE